LIANNAYLQSLHCDDDELYNPNPNKRENQYTKMAEREQIAQIGRNPFLEGTNNYVNDVSIRDQFLKPISTSAGKNEATPTTTTTTTNELSNQNQNQTQLN